MIVQNQERPLKKKSLFFAKIWTREEALKLIQESALGFIFVALLQAIVSLSLLHQPLMLFDSAIYFIAVAFMWRFHSRVAAVILLVVSFSSLAATLLNWLGVHAYGGRNIFLASLMLWVAVRAVEATFRLHGEFK